MGKERYSLLPRSSLEPEKLALVVVSILLVGLLGYTLHLRRTMKRSPEDFPGKEPAEGETDQRHAEKPWAEEGGAPLPGPRDGEEPSAGGSREGEAPDPLRSRLLKAERGFYSSRFALVWATWDRADALRIRGFLGRCDPRFRNWEWGWLSRLAREDSVALHAGFQKPSNLLFSPDGKLAVVGCYETGTHVFDAATGMLLYAIPDPKHPRLLLSFSPDGSRFAFPARGNALLIFDAKTGRSVMELKGHTSSVLYTAWSPAGDKVASGGYDGRVILWDAKTGERLHVLEGGYGCVERVAFNPDGRELASSDNHGALVIWDVKSGRRLKELVKKGKEYASFKWIGFSSRGGSLGALGSYRDLRVWATHTGRVKIELPEKARRARDAVLSPDLSLLAYDSGGGVSVVDTKTGQRPRRLKGGPSKVVKVAFGPEGKRLAGGDRDGGIRIWDVESGRTTRILSGHEDWIKALAFSADGRRLASASGDKTVKIWDVDSSPPVKNIPCYMADCFAFDPSWSRVAVGEQDGKIGVWDLATQRLLREIDTKSDGVVVVAYGPAGRVIASGDFSKRLNLWDAEEGSELWRVECETYPRFVAFDSTGERLLAGCGKGAVRMLDARSGRRVAGLKLAVESTGCYALSHDGACMATGGGKGGIAVHDAQTGALLVELKGHTDDIQSLVFGPDGRLLASASEDHTVRVWDARSGREVLVLKGHTNHVRTVAFSPDGQRLASGGWDRTARVWDVDNGIELLRLEMKRVGVEGLAFSPDGSTLAVFCHSEILLYEADPWQSRSPHVSRPSVK